MRPTHRFLIWLSLACIAVALYVQSDSLEWVKRYIRYKFPDVSQISIDEFQRWRISRSNDDLVLLDVRTREEYEVSNIQGSQLATSLKDALKLLTGVPKDQLIVAYCSVGYRSSDLVRALTERGYNNAYNLEGSIFEWANRRLPVYRGNEPVNKVHPYNSTWGRFLNDLK